jgi:23S rRNA (guanosine2251-2'-O)-methyltransferase
MSETPEIIAGRNPVREALLAGTWTINKILLSQRAHGTAIEEIIRLARDRQIPLHHVPPERLDRLSTTPNQGVVAEISPEIYLDLPDLWKKIRDNPRPLVVVLDGIEDPHNVGAIIRSAVAFGADGIVIGKWRQAGLTETVARTSAGASAHIPIARVTNIAQAVTELKEYGIWVAGAEADGRPIGEEKFAFPLAIVIGSEGHGLHRLVRERCDLLVSIPQSSVISSLNASCAAAVIFYEIAKARQLPAR